MRPGDRQGHGRGDLGNLHLNATTGTGDDGPRCPAGDVQQYMATWATKLGRHGGTLGLFSRNRTGSDQVRPQRRARSPMSILHRFNRTCNGLQGFATEERSSRHGPVWSHPGWSRIAEVNPSLSGNRRTAWRGIRVAVGPADVSSICPCCLTGGCYPVAVAYGMQPQGSLCPPGSFVRDVSAAPARSWHR
jgi:hypothetical protein